MRVGLIVGMMVAYVSLHLLFFAMSADASGGGIGVTTLTQAVSANGTAAIHVTSTVDFATTGYIIIGDERIAYTGKTATTFTGITRAQEWHDEATEAEAHANGSKVYNEEGYALNASSSYQGVAAQDDSFLGSIGTILTTAFHFMTHTIPQIIAWDYPFFDGSLAYVRFILLYPLNIGLVITLLFILRRGVF